jgi:hypothetical protein
MASWKTGTGRGSLKDLETPFLPNFCNLFCDPVPIRNEHYIFAGIVN